MTPKEQSMALEYAGGADESILLLIEEGIRNDGAKEVDLAALADYLGKLAGLAVVPRSERPDDGVLARAMAWMMGEALVDFHERFARASEGAAAG